MFKVIVLTSLIDIIVLVLSSKKNDRSPKIAKNALISKKRDKSSKIKSIINNKKDNDVKTLF